MSERIPAPVPYDPAWPLRFEAERERLERVLSPWLSGGIHHIGSTSVPGLAAKPVLDMIAGVRNLEDARAAFEPLGALGYQYREHRPEAHAFRKPGFSLHLTQPGSDLWRERLAFRDALRGDPALVAEYAEWKEQHATAAPVGDYVYTANKRPFVLKVLAAAGVDLKPDDERLSEAVARSRREASGPSR